MSAERASWMANVCNEPTYCMNGGSYVAHYIPEPVLQRQLTHTHTRIIHIYFDLFWFYQIPMIVKVFEPKIYLMLSYRLYWISGHVH